MSLQIWLPLRGNLVNYGVSGLQTASVQSGVAVSNDGKIGQCYKNSGTTANVATAVSFTSTQFSMTAWVRIDAKRSNWCRATGLSGPSGIYMGMACESTNGTSIGFHFYKTINGTNTRIFDNYPVNVEVGTWVHYAMTYDGTKYAVYKNGTSVVSGNVDVPNTLVEVSNLYIFGGNASGYSSCSLNDVRVYDHCLSPKEVKEISKGLVCHYPLDNNGSGMPNLVPNQGKYYSESTAYVRTSASKDGNAWLSGSHFIVEPSTTYTFSVYSDGNLAASHNTAGTDPSLKAFTMWLYLCNSDTTKNPDAGGYDNPVCFTSANYSHQQFGNRHIWQYTTKSTETHMSVRVNNYSNGTNNLTIKYWQIKIEKSNTASPWCPNSTDASYSIFNINSNKEIDISGYGNHGTKSGTITYNSDTPRYSISTVFNGSNTFIACGRGGMVKDAITVSLWAYQSSWSSFTRPISCTEGGGWNFEASGNYISFQCGTGTSSNTYKPVNSQKTYASLAAGWHMFTATYDGLASKIYIDGVLDNTATSYTTKTPIFYNSANGIFIGAEAGGNQTTPAGTYFNGKISDFRIYATALSADDVKQLYQTSASIDNNGNVFCSDIQEV